MDDTERLAIAIQTLKLYANPRHWDGDFHGVKRKWLEPDSNTMNAYAGYELAQKTLDEIAGLPDNAMYTAKPAE